jgi:hypothetical protein
VNTDLMAARNPVRPVIWLLGSSRRIASDEDRVARQERAAPERVMNAVLDRVDHDRDREEAEQQGSHERPDGRHPLADAEGDDRRDDGQPDERRR